jgi:RNA polymerase sigma factor (sigma-70 family)
MNDTAIDNIDPVAAYYYGDVGRYTKPLSLSEEKAITEKLARAKRLIIKYLVAQPEVFNFFLEDCGRRLAEPGASLAKMAEDYNSKIPGLNQKITSRILTALDERDLLKCNFKYTLYEKAYSNLPLDRWHVNNLRELIVELEHQLIFSVLQMVVKVSKQYGSDKYAIEEKDLVQAGNERLLKAVKLYKPGQCRFSTFAYHKIRSGVRRHIMENSRLVSLPIQKVSNILLVLEASNNLEKHMRSFVPAILLECRRLDKKWMITEREIHEALRNLAGHSLTLDAPVKSNNETVSDKPKSLLESLADERVDIEEIVNEKILAETSEQAILDVLSDMEAAVIYFRYLDPSFIPKRKTTERPYQEIPHLFREHRMCPKRWPMKSREAIRGIERIALEKLMFHSRWFWTRIRDEAMAPILTENEIRVLFAQTINPRLKGKPMLSWSEASKVLNSAPHNVMRLRRSALKKLRPRVPRVVEWLHGT